MTEDKNWSYPHEWAREADGSILNHELGDYHDGPECLRCGLITCDNCQPGIWDEACADQDDELFAPPFTKIQMDVRLRYLNKMGYIVRAGIIVGRGEPVTDCKPNEHVWTPNTKVTVGWGVNKRVYGTKRCVKCSKVVPWP